MTKLPQKSRGWLFAVPVVMILWVIGHFSGDIQLKHKSASTQSARPSSTTPPPTSSKPAPSAPPTLDWRAEAPPYPSDVLVRAYQSVCQGHPVRSAARYTGRQHPIVVVGGELGGWEDEIFAAEPAGYPWPPEMKPTTVASVQLVACVSTSHVADPSCGYYTRESDGVSGELRRSHGVARMRMVVAGTAALIWEKTFVAEPPYCNSVTNAEKGPPPWTMKGDPPAFVQATSPDPSEYVRRFTTGPPRAPIAHG